MPLKVIARDGTELTVEDSGEGLPIVLLHGVTATRGYVVLGSDLLTESGYRVIAYDARGHGDSGAAPRPGRYGYDVLEEDLAAVMDHLQLDRAVLAGVSMGAHTALRYALHHPERVAGVAAITPGFAPERFGDRELMDLWATWAEGLRQDGAKGFVEAYRFPPAGEREVRAMKMVVRRRLRLHRDPAATADALVAITRSKPYETIEELSGVGVPSVVIATHDTYDLDHPYDVAVRYAEALGCDLVVEDPGEPPLVFRGAAISRVILQVAERASGDRASAS